MGRKWKIAAIILLVVIGLLYLSLKSPLVLEPVKGMILSSLTRQIPWPIVVENVGLNVVPPSLTLYDVKIFRSREDPDPFLRTEKVTAVFSLWSLLTEVAVVKQIRIVSPHLTIDQSGGTLSPASPGPLFADKLPSVPLGKPTVVVVRNLGVSDGTLELRYPDDAFQLTVTGVNLSVYPDLDMRQFQIQLGTETADFRYGPISKQFDKMEAELTAKRNSIEVHAGRVRAPGFSMDITGVVRDITDLDYSIMAEGVFPLSELQPFFPDQNSLSGTLHSRTEITGSRTTAVTASGQVRLSEASIGKVALGNARSHFLFSDQNLSISDFSASFLNGTIQGEGLAGFESEPPTFQVSLEAKGIAAGPLLALIDGSGFLPNHLLDGTAALSGQGLDIRTLSGKGSVTVRRDSGASEPEGDPENWVAWINRLQDISVPFSVNRGSLLLEESTARSSRSEVRLAGSLDANRALDMRFRLDSREVHDFSPWIGLDFIRGRFEAEGTLTGLLEHPRVAGDGTLSDATVRHRHFQSISGHIDYEHPRLIFTDAVFREGRSTYQLSGLLSFDPNLPAQPHFELLADITEGVPREVVALFWEELPLTITVTGSLTATGHPKAFQVAADLAVGPGLLFGQPVDEGRLNLGVTQEEVSFQNVVARRGESTVTGNGRILFNGGFELNAATSETHLSDIARVSDALPELSAKVDGSLAGTGRLEEPEFELDASLSEFSYRGQMYGNGSLSVKFAEKSLLLITALESGLSARLETQWAAPFPFRFAASLAEFDAGAVMHRIVASENDGEIPVTATLWGQLTGEGTFQELNKSTLDLRLNRVSLGFREFSLVNDGDIEVVMKGETVEFRSLSLSGESVHLAVSGTLRPAKSFDLLVTGEADLGLLRDFTEEIPFARGPVRLSLQIQDTWSEPLIRGQATIEEGRIRSKTFNQFITINSMELSFDQKQVVLETFEGKIGGGKLLAGGRWDLEGFSSKKYSINLELESFRFNAISGLNAIVNASLLLQATPEGKSLNGEVLIQRASYDRRIDWQRFVLDVLKGDRESKTALPVGEDVRLNIQILGKDNIRINNNLAEIPLEIDLLLRGTLERPVLLGRMEARGGLIRFRQNDFKIESGAVDFIDPDRLRPILDISATTRIRTTYKVRLTLVGPIDQLELSLSSDPPLASHEILALLTFGTVPEDIDQTQMELVAGAEALDLLTGDIQIAVEEQAKKFGIDCLRVDPLFSNPKTPGTPRVTVCKRLWEDSFYVTYITTFDASGEDILQMEYLINENVSLVGGRDEIGDLGGDLKFRFEFR